MLIDLNQITKEIKPKDGDLDKIRKYCKFMFKMVRDTMEEKKYESIGLQYLGTFRVKPARLSRLKDKGIDIGEHGDRIVEEFKQVRNEYNREL